MKEYKVIKTDTLNYGNIRFGDYFRSLCTEAHRCNIITDERMTCIKDELSVLLRHTIESYTDNQSTSVMQDTANELFYSVLYTLDVCLMGFHSHETAIKHIIENSVDTLYYNGRKIVRRFICECVSMLVKCKRTRICLPLKGYDNVLDSEIMGYLKRYDERFYAHTTKRELSYHTVNGCGGMRGIIYLKRYLENLYYENCFVGRFEKEKTEELLYRYSLIHEYEYNEPEINIYSVVLLNCVFASLAGYTDGRMDVTVEDAKKVTSMLKKYNEKEQYDIIEKSVEVFSMDEYVEKSIRKLSGHIVNAVKNNTVRKLIVLGEL